jgi:hypothetical protein
MRGQGRNVASLGQEHHRQGRHPRRDRRDLVGQEAGRESDEEITMFDSTGMAIQDNTTAARIYRNALERQVGTFFSFFER